MKVRYPGEDIENGESAKTVRDHLQDIYTRLERLESAVQKKEPPNVDGSGGATQDA